MGIPKICDMKLIRMSAPLQKGCIEYNRTIETDYGIYSIDRFTFNFRLSETLFVALKFSLETWSWRFGQTDVQRFEAKRFSQKVDVFQYGKLHVELWKTDTLYCMKLDYSPNHCKNHRVFQSIIDCLNRTNETFSFDLSRVDFAYDIPVALADVFVLSRKAEGNVGATRYYGKRGSNGMLRVYDKRAEEALNNHKEIGLDVTRLEWEQRGGRDLTFTFDTFCTADFSGLSFPASVIPFIQPENINKAFKAMSKNTRTSYRRLFKPYPFNPAIFSNLLALYFDSYGVFEHRWNYSESGISGALADRSETCSISLLPSLATLDEKDDEQ